MLQWFCLFKFLSLQQLQQRCSNDGVLFSSFLQNKWMWFFNKIELSLSPLSIYSCINSSIILYIFIWWVIISVAATYFAVQIIWPLGTLSLFFCTYDISCFVMNASFISAQVAPPDSSFGSPGLKFTFPKDSTNNVSWSLYLASTPRCM